MYNTKKGKKSKTEKSTPRGFDRKLEAKEIVTTVVWEGNFMFIMEWHGTDDLDLVNPEEAMVKCPLVVTHYYEKGLPWIKS